MGPAKYDVEELKFQPPFSLSLEANSIIQIKPSILNKIMDPNKNEKQFDAVKMMRDIRDKISAETQNMTFDELKAYIKQQLTDSKSKLVGQK